MNAASLLLLGGLSLAVVASAGAQGRPPDAPPVAGAAAPDQVRDQDRLRDRDAMDARRRDRMRDHEMMYGYDLMTPRERAEYRSRMRSLHTEREREAFRMQHHEMMKARARERGIELPELPPARGRRGGP